MWRADRPASSPRAVVAIRIAFAAASLVGAFAAVAEAADPKPADLKPADLRPAEAADDRGVVQPLITDAVSEYDAGHFEEARALFRRAHAQSPSARTLRGIGMASFELRDYVEATRALGAALREQRHPLSPELRQHVHGLLARAETYVGRFTLHLRPANTSLVVDGVPPELEPDGTLLLSFGRHQIVARCPSCAQSERDIEVIGGERQTLEIAPELGPRGRLDGPAATQTTAPSAGGDGSESAGTGRSNTPYWLGGTALVATAGAIAGAFWWHDRSGQLDDCRMSTMHCQNEQTLSTQSNIAAGVTLGFGAAAITTAIAAAILWTHHERGAGQAVACAANMKEVSCAFRF
jgi:hypothetical protein